MDIPDKVFFGSGEFGWDFNKLSTTGEKASYLYTAIRSFGDSEALLKKLAKILDKKNIKYEFQKPSGDKWAPYGYIDHSDKTRDFVEAILHSERRLMRFLFSNESFVLTGNDNSDFGVEIEVDYHHEEFYKGN
ncbi:MAG: hypothetical protein RR365_10785 [Bacteroides sp.]